MNRTVFHPAVQNTDNAKQKQLRRHQSLTAHPENLLSFAFPFPYFPLHTRKQFSSSAASTHTNKDSDQKSVSCNFGKSSLRMLIDNNYPLLTLLPLKVKSFCPENDPVQNNNRKLPKNISGEEKPPL